MVTRNAPFCIALCAGLLLGCSPASELTGGLAPPVTGSLTVTIDGLPTDAPALVTVTNAKGYTRQISSTETLSALAPGAYSVSALEVPVGLDRYGAAAATQNVVVAAGLAPAAAHVGYAAITGHLHVALDSVPEGATAQISVTGPGGYSRALSDSATLAGLAPGLYSIAALRIEADGDYFDPEPTLQSIQVAPLGAAPGAAAVKFARSSGRMAVAVSGLPVGVPAAVQVTGPGGFSRVVTASTTLTGLVPGSYAVTSQAVTTAGNGYQPNPASVTVAITASNKPESVSVAYALATGSLQVLVAGLPGGVAGAVSVTGPQGFAANITVSTLLTGLGPGDYTVVAAGVPVAPALYVPSPPTQTVTIVASLTAEVRSVSYAIGTGSLDLTIAGVPAGASGSVAVSGPGGYQQTLAASQTLTGLTPGAYTIAGAPITVSGTLYGPSPVSQNVTVAVGATASATVSYSAQTGGLTLTISGLPGGAPANVQVTGAGGYSQHFTASQTLAGLVPGTYTVTASAITAGSTVYSATPVSQVRSVTAGSVVSAAVVYVASTGALAVTVSGLPGGAAAAIVVTGPGAFSQSLTGSQTLTGLTPGGYTVSGSSIVSAGATYNPSAPQAVAVAAGSSAGASITYVAAGGGASLNLRIDGVYLTQATQTYDGLVPLVAGRDAYLRAFTVANQSNTAQPQVRIRLYSGATLVQTYTIAAPSAGVPSAVNEGTLSSSWNVLVPAALVQPGLRVLADVDPANGISEADESDNQFPVTGASAAVDVRTLPAFAVRFVPVLQQVNGLQGNVTDANKDAFLAATKAMLPVGAYSADVRAVYTTTAPALESGNGNGSWGTILSEVLALKSTDASTRYYYGVVKTSYGSGVVGMGYVGGSARTSIGWDVMSNAPSTVAHELGHNMGRSHAPCGGPGGPDPSYPYAGGLIGVLGFDVSTLTIKATSIADLMGYCQPTWISDYNWKAMLTYRQGGPNNAPPALLAGSGLLVWGRITGDSIVLEPAFRVAARADLVPVTGPNLVELLGGDGRLLRSVRFDASEVADLPTGAERHFAFVVPLDAATEVDLAGIRVRSGRRTTSRLPSPAGDPGQVLSRVNAEQVQVRWNATQYPMVMVKDARSGQVLSFARGGSARLWARSGEFQLIFSDGVKSVTRQGRILQ